MIFTILGTKGGVGKSSLAIGVSIHLSKRERTLLIDGDPHVRSVELKLAPGMEHSLVDYMRGRAKWKDVVYRCSLEKDGKLLYSNLAVVPAGASFLPPIGEGEGLLRGAEKLEGMLKETCKKFSYVVIDTPASVSYEHILLTAAGDGIIYVCEANDDSILAARATAGGMRKLLDVPPTGVVLSRIPPRVKPEPWIRKAGEIAPVLGVVPFDPQLDEAFRRNLPVDAFALDSRANLAFAEIAGKLSGMKGGKVAVRERIDRALDRIARLLEERAEK
jgi:MinD-like ATPase involved in chromosome partitioning or flagellar assembly